MLATEDRAVVSDGLRYKTLWIADKWSEDAVKFCQRVLEREGVTHIPMSHGIEQAKLVPIRHAISSAVLRSLVGEPEECTEIQGNMLLNEGISLLENLSMVASGLVSNQVATNYWSNTNSYLGVGDSSTAEGATQVELQAASNRFYKVMNATYPTKSSQTVSFQADFTTTEANYVWNEWTISAGATSASGAGFLNGTTNLNRKVASLGTKASGTWTLTAQLTIS